MTKRAFGLFLTITGACAVGVGCSSSSNTSGTGGASGAVGGRGGAGGVAGAGGTGTGGVATGVGGRLDAGTDVPTGVDARPDLAVDAPSDVPADGAGDTGVAPTFTQVFAQVLNNTTTPTPDTSPGCANCHDGMPVDGGNANQMISHSISYRDKAAAYLALVGNAVPAAGVDSLRCAGVDGGPAIKRVRPFNPDESVLVQKLRQGLGIGTACDNVPMPLNPPIPADGGADAGPDGGFATTHHAITMAQLDLIVAWINAGALNN